jgi:3-hydroxyacyl-CoA dehydrogenase
MNVEEIKKILVVGAGSMGEGIVQNFAQSGFHVVLLDDIYYVVESAPSLVKHVEAGELGVKTGKGWHDYNGQSREQVLKRSNRRMLKVLQTFNGLN